MPKAKSPEMVEGDVIEKDHILSLKKEIDSFSDEIDTTNIREEGLDRRVFSVDSIVPRHELTQKTYASKKTGLIMNQVT